ncbi:hypothetical protein B296_00004700 [Ensete ventricosum]|uniref:Uncharacterized protein n=1 Tax=Ensete ventricosum TaxID=4639 RepID=A0A427B7Z4_ENSVE|nr:hypothetical protein B296_00004700 [Ensete ventricosum]
MLLRPLAPSNEPPLGSAISPTTHPPLVKPCPETPSVGIVSHRGAGGGHPLLAEAPHAIAQPPRARPSLAQPRPAN